MRAAQEDPRAPGPPEIDRDPEETREEPEIDVPSKRSPEIREQPEPDEPEMPGRDPREREPEVGERPAPDARRR